MSASAHSVRTSCPYCGVGCGIVASRDASGAVAIAGDDAHPANFGRLCSKGSALAETLGESGRVLHPRAHGRRASWRDATALVARRFAETIAAHGPDAVAFYVSGQLLTEDYYVANKLMKGFIGSANIDTNSRLCMASAVAGQRRAFGADTVPGTYSDLECADLVVLVGSNLAWCHPVLHQRLLAARAARPRMKIVVIDPRRTVTAQGADLHLALHPDSDVALFGGLLQWLAAAGALDTDYVARYTRGLDEALAAGSGLDLARTAALTGLAVRELRDFFELFRTTPRSVTVFSQGVNQSASGTDKVNAILNVHLASGRIGTPGAGPFSITGQPNAMGGREAGGLASTLAAHMAIEDAAARDRVQRFWRAPVIAQRAGLKAVELFDAIARGEVKAIWIMATNPVDSMPRAREVEAALAACPFVAVSEIYEGTDTLAHAHVVLPAAGWLEKNGTVTNSERRISRQRPLLVPPGEARPDWWIVSQVARRMGHRDAFAYTRPAQVFAEHAALSAFENDGRRDFDLEGLTNLSEAAYDALQPVQWPVPRAGARREYRFFANGGFSTPDRRARLIPVALPAPRAPAHPDALVLNTGRVRDHWHTMTRTGRSARLSAHVAEPCAELHPRDAQRRGIGDGDLLRLHNAAGELLLRARITPAQRAGSVFVPMHWSDAFASRARVNTLVAAHTDPVSGQPALKQGLVLAQRVAAAWHAFAVTRVRPGRDLLDAIAPYWCLAPCAAGWRVELAGLDARADWDTQARALFVTPAHDEMLAYRDAVSGDHRFAAFAHDALAGALFVARTPLRVSRDWLAEVLSTSYPDQHARSRIIAGRPGADRPDPGPMVCVCNGVGRNQILAAISSGGCCSVDEIGAAVNAGTGCGSCRSEIEGILQARHADAAE